MAFLRFGKKQLADIVKVQQFCEKEGITFDLLVDHLDLQVGDATHPTPSVQTDLPPVNPSPIKAEENPGWAVAKHDGAVCSDINCTNAHHYFAEVS